MLTGMVSSSLTVVSSERHAYQHQAVKMLSETILTVQTQMQNSVTQCQAKVDNSDRAQAERSASLAKADSDCAILETTAASAKAAVDEGKAAVSATKADLATAQAAIDSNDQDWKAQSELKLRAEAALRNIYAPLKSAKTTGHEGRKNLNTLEKVLQDLGVEAGLVEHVPETLRKDPESRRTFDAMVFQHVDARTKSW